MSSRNKSKPVTSSAPADLQRYPQGCPDPEWCRGNRLCYWDCAAEPDLYDTLEEKRDNIDPLDRLIETYRDE